MVSLVLILSWFGGHVEEGSRFAIASLWVRHPRFHVSLSFKAFRFVQIPFVYVMFLRPGALPLYLVD